ncbi:MAG: CCDC90 family protein [Gammaproteobacteria bacterium]|nr:CCDC90 family protein [Gammaproteobacteria bacterium]
MSHQRDIDNIIESLKQQKDEIRLQIHLAKAEVRDELSELEKKLEELGSKADVLRKEAADTSSNVIEASKLVADEIKQGFERIRKLL